MDEHIILRPADKADCPKIAELAMIAGEGIPAFFWQQAARPGQNLFEVGTHNAASETENFSYRNTHLAEVNGEVAAMLLAYRLPAVTEAEDLDDFPEFIRPMIELEQLVPESFYINMLATFPEYRNRSLGSRLLELANILASEANCDILSIQVFEQNAGALRLYLRHGYKAIARRPVIPHPCHHYTGDLVLLTREAVSNNI